MQQLDAGYPLTNFGFVYKTLCGCALDSAFVV